MKQSLAQIKKEIREAYLEAEKDNFSKLQDMLFRLVKDWD